MEATSFVLRWWERRSTPGLVAAAAALLVYALTLGHGFVSDDGFILKSPMLAHPWNLRELLSDGFYAPHERTTGLYRPLGQWSLVLNAELARSLTGSADRPWMFHAVNVLLHALASFLVYAWLSRLPIPRFAAGAAAILWAVHPVHAEVAANVTARYESLSLVFGLAYLIAHRSRRWFAASVWFLCALWSKESALAFLPLALAVDALFPMEGRRFAVRAVLPALVVLGVWFALRAHALQFEDPSTSPVENVVVDAPPLPRVLTAAKVQVLYLRDQVLPLWLSSDHSYAQIELVRSAFDAFVLCFVGILVLSVFAAWRTRRSEPGIALAVLGWAILFALASNFLVPIGTIMADRLAYAPSIFTCLLAGLLVGKLSSRSLGPIAWGAWAALAALTIPLAAASFLEAREWRDELTLFREQVRTAPRSTKSHAQLGNALSNLGYALHDDGVLRQAVAEYEKSIAIRPFRPDTHFCLAQCYDLLDEDPELRVEAWADSIRNWRRIDAPTGARILTFVDLGRWNDVRRLRAELAAADPRQPALVRVDRMLAAVDALTAAPVGDASNGGELFRYGDYAGAEYEYRRALHRGEVPERELAETLQNLSVCNERLGRADRARDFAALAAAAKGRL